ncbi:putative entry exclusion protein TrbK-alt [Sphingomonas donggukensis]|uniref:Entry exclusion protein TrbK-alt n=1 Tax=Sphingomonas donggukensis TaxID=2949093 RepID=A0ABY4TTZ2_9SPHN|nr:putative entry exclusion protein TrbK-alt [Sphingomonas donggukensis]URW75869.1 putative entry exclusion protein TrbK-alt [Sphingomonas donggukensis]
MPDVAPLSDQARRARYVLIALGLGTLGALAAAVATQSPDDRRSPSMASRSAYPIAATLLRCQALGDAALADSGCRAAWAEHRRRFLAREGRP